jgi:hypothetical protein
MTLDPVPAPRLTATYRLLLAACSLRNSFVNFSGVFTFLNEKGKPLCEKSYKGRVNYAVSGDGRWLAISQFSSVDLWRVEDLLRDCDSGL